MPNGDSDFNLQQLDRFFGGIAAVLATFAEQHNLRVEKYYHQEPSWAFTFRHPKGGVGKIAIQRAEEATVRILSVWWYDDFEAETRFIKSATVGPMPLNSEMAGELEKALSDLLSWRFGEWHERHAGYTTWRKMWTKEQFQKLPAEYPEPLP